MPPDADAHNNALPHKGSGTSPVVVLSPHPDDAVLSAWHALTSGTMVITVFCDVPPLGTLTLLDASHGALDSSSWMIRRRKDDRMAVAFAGASVIQLNFADVQYRFNLDGEIRRQVALRPANFARLMHGRSEAEASLDLLDEIESVVVGHLNRDTVLYAPLGIGGHPDHVATMLIAARISGQVSEVRFYADTPYFLRHGLPSWLSGNPQSAADTYISAALRTAFGSAEVRRRAVELPEIEARRKVAAIYMYGTEVAGLRAGYPEVLNPDVVRHEAYWSSQP